MAGQAIWFEIPSTQFERAVKFYEAVFSVTLKRENIGGAMAVFSGEGGASGAIVDQQPGYAPSKVGPVVYLDAGTDLTPVIDRVVKAGGKVVLPRTALPPGMGFFAHFEDSEGNRVGMHSMG